MLLTSQQERVCSKKSLVLMRGQEFQKQSVFKSTGSVWSRCSNSCWKNTIHSVTAFHEQVCAAREWNYKRHYPGSLMNGQCVFSMSPHTCNLLSSSCQLWVAPLSHPSLHKRKVREYRSSHSGRNTTPTKVFLFPICRTLDSISFSSPRRYIYFRTLFIYLPICQRVVQKVDETASGLPFM